jgi:hypothetical protein
MNLPWSELAVEQQTIVFYMALKGAPHLSEQLQTHGMRGDMPVALVEKGTTLLLSGMSFSEPNWLWLSFFVGFNLFQSAFTGFSHFSPTWRFFKPSLSPARTRFKEITNWAKIGFF